MLQEKLLETAIRQFGLLGFDGASTRKIAQESGTAMSSITYHFDSKLGLYLACAEHIAKQIRARLKSVSDRIDAAGDTIGPERARELLLELVDGFAQIMLDPASEAWSRFIVREQQAPTEAFDRLYEGAMHGVVDGASKLLAAVWPDLDDTDLRARALLIMGQALFFRAARASVCRTLDVERIGEAEAALLRRLLRQHIDAILNGEQ